jgi:hypothetical protein
MRGHYGRHIVYKAAIITAMACTIGVGGITARADETGTTTVESSQQTTEQTTTEEATTEPFYGLTFKKTSEKSFTCNSKGIITAYTGKKKATEIIVPATIDGITVKGIGKEVFSGLEQVTTIGLPDTVTSFGDEAFSGCTSLNTMFSYDADSEDDVRLSYDENSIITIPDKLKSIGTGAFADCTAIYKFAVADSNNYFKAGTWVATTSANQNENTTSVTRSSGEMLLSKDGKTLLRFAPAFHYTGEGLYKLPTGLVYIAPYACEAVSLNGGFTIPNTVTTIGDYGFYKCGNLNNIKFAKTSSVEAIGNYAFANNPNLTITLPASVKTIGNYCFAYCVNIVIDISKTQLEVLPDYAFYECDNLHNLQTPKTLKSVGAYVFYGCNCLNEVEFLGDTLESIGTGAFQSCDNLHTIEVPEGVKTIADDTFDGCHNLNTIILPDSLKNIGDSAFKDCNNIHELVIPSGVTHISNNSFTGANKDAIDTTKNQYSQKFIKGKLPEKGTTFVTGKLKYVITKSSKKKGTVAVVGVKSKKLTSVKIGKTIMYKGYKFKITSISVGAFKNCKKLKKVTIGGNVKSIGANAFYKCIALKKITIPAKVTKIGKKAFYGCKKLQNITIKTTKLTAKKVGSQAFKGIKSTAKIKVPKKKYKAYKKLLKSKGVSKKGKIYK